MNATPTDIQPLKRRTSIGADIAAQLQRLIQDGSFAPGTTLPSQRELARRFGASVPSVREAISVLTASGMLETRTGHGTIVRTLTSATPAFDGWLGLASSEDELHELLQARRILEEFTLTAAAERSTATQAAELHAILGEMRAGLGDPDRYADADMRLHMTIAEIAGNRVVTRLMRIIQAPLARLLRQSVTHLHANNMLHVSLRDHEHMVRAIIEGDGRGACQFMYNMLGRNERFNDQPAPHLPARQHYP